MIVFLCVHSSFLFGRMAWPTVAVVQDGIGNGLEKEMDKMQSTTEAKQALNSSCLVPSCFHDCFPLRAWVVFVWKFGLTHCCSGPGWHWRGPRKGDGQDAIHDRGRASFQLNLLGSHMFPTLFSFAWIARFGLEVCFDQLLQWCRIALKRP